MKNDLKRTALYNSHIKQNAKMVDFGGWSMPIQYNSILSESKSVRTKSGIFDVSHMGRIDISGNDSSKILNQILSVDIEKIEIGKAKYNLICNKEGGIIDDCIIYKTNKQNFLLIPNASNSKVVLEWIDSFVSNNSNILINDITSNTVMIAYQGPDSIKLLQNITLSNLEQIKPFNIQNINIDKIKVSIARTGYTGEDGFEIIADKKDGHNLWEKLIRLGATPCGLGARDILRLEASLPLHGNEINLSTNPYEANLGKFIYTDKNGYIAKNALEAIANKGPKRKLVGLEVMDRIIPRKGHEIIINNKIIGNITSGGYSSTLNKPIAVGYVPIEFSDLNTKIQIKIREKLVESYICKIPFYKRRKAK